MNKISLRPALLDDLPTLYAFEQGIIDAERPFDPTLKPDPINYYDLKVMIQIETTEVIVALVDNEIIGSGYVTIKEAEPFQKHDLYAYLGFMYVKPEFRGKGIIQKITDELKLWAKSKNLSEIRLEVYDENLPAVSAYEKSGFKKHMAEMRLEI